MTDFKKVAIGNLEMKEYAVEKPVSITADGKFILPSEVIDKPSLALGSLFALDENLQVKLTLERNKIEPDYKLGIMGLGVVSKEEVLENVESGTEFGREVVRAEMNYCNELMTTLSSGDLPSWPEIPEAKPTPIPKEWKWIPPKYRYIAQAWALFCENTTDSITKYAAEYRKKYVHPVFKQRGFKIAVLEGVDDIRSKFTPIAVNKRVVYMGGIGHGSPTVYTGDKNSPILKVGAYDPVEVKNKRMHFLSCQTARQLGPDTIKKGAVAYGGYYENFTFVYDQQGTPTNEMELFWKCDSTFDIMKALGATVEDAYNATINTYNAAIASIPNTEAAKWLTWDRDYFRTPAVDAAYGDKKATISPWVLLPLTPFMELDEIMEDLSIKE